MSNSLVSFADDHSSVLQSEVAVRQRKMNRLSLVRPLAFLFTYFYRVVVTCALQEMWAGHKMRTQWAVDE